MSIKGNKQDDQKKEEKKKDQFIRERNWQTQQICFMIGLLNLVGDIMLEQPLKMETKALSLFKVSHIILNDKFYDVKALTQERVQKLIEKDELNEVLKSTIKKRSQTYRILEHIHVLIDILNHTRFKISTSHFNINFIEDKRSLDTVNLDSILFFKKDIEQIGSKIHHALVDIVHFSHTSHVFHLPRGNTEFMSIILSDN